MEALAQNSEFWIFLLFFAHVSNSRLQTTTYKWDPVLIVIALCLTHVKMSAMKQSSLSTPRHISLYLKLT